MYAFEDDLVGILKLGARQINDCVQGRISFENFLAVYDNLYDRFALDGHEYDNEDVEQAILDKYSSEISLHEEIRDEILYKITDDLYITRPEVIKAGFIGHIEGLSRLKQLAEKYSLQINHYLD